MKKENADFTQIVETKFELINLKLQASKIRNSRKVQESLDSLMNFVGAKNRACYGNT